MPERSGPQLPGPDRSGPELSGPELSGPVATVPVPGGLLTYEVVVGTSEPVLAIHGVSSQRRLWDWLHAEAPELSLIAPDLRGRGDSADITGPFSIDQHVEDMVAVLDAFGVAAVHVCGMSMGGFVAVRLAVAHPDRVKSLVLVDGGFPMDVPSSLTREMVPGLFADRRGRLERIWPSLDAYVEFFVASTGPLLDANDPLLRANLAHDLRDGRVRLSPDALVEDAADLYFGPNPWQQLRCPVRFLHAEWGAGPLTAPGYPAEAVALYRPATVATEFLPGLDHAGTIMTRPGARRVALMINHALAEEKP